MNSVEHVQSALEAKAAELDRHAEHGTSSFFRAIYQSQSAILREFATELAATTPPTDIRGGMIIAAHAPKPIRGSRTQGISRSTSGR